MNQIVKVGNHDVVEIEWKGQRVITTAQLAEVYEANEQQVQQNFNNHIERFKEGKHYFLLKGDDLRLFKNCFDDIEVVGKRAPQLYLWTHRGASRHCKIFDTDKAWEQFDCLEENYFNPNHAQAVTYQYPVSPAAMESATNAGRLFERIMRREGAAPQEVAFTVKSLFNQAGIDVPDCVVKIPAYEQIGLPLDSLN